MIVENPKNKFYYLPGLKGYGNRDFTHRVELETEEEPIKAGLGQAPLGKETGR